MSELRTMKPRRAKEHMPTSVALRGASRRAGRTRSDIQARSARPASRTDQPPPDNQSPRVGPPPPPDLTSSVTHRTRVRRRSRGDQRTRETHTSGVAAAASSDQHERETHDCIVEPGGEGGAVQQATPVRELLPLAPLVSVLRELHRQRQDFHNAEKRLTLQIKAIQRRTHARSGCEKKLHAACPGVYDVETLTTAALAEARHGFEVQRKTFEREMERAAKKLPVYAWVDSVRGFGALGLAQVVAECGDLAGYSNPAKVWKRMGVGLGPAGEAYYEGRSPSRRAILYCIGESMVKAGGPYKVVYDERKAYEAARPACRRQFKTGGECLDEETGACRKIHLHLRAKRYMEKRLLRDLWRAWRATTGLAGRDTPYSAAEVVA